MLGANGGYEAQATSDAAVKPYVQQRPRCGATGQSTAMLVGIARQAAGIPALRAGILAAIARSDAAGCAERRATHACGSRPVLADDADENQDKGDNPYDGRDTNDRCPDVPHIHPSGLIDRLMFVRQTACRDDASQCRR
jgi:hypothetical protein